MRFDCDKCGQCCKNLRMSELYSELDSGNGTCKYLEDNLCTIYSKRPLICRIDECYEHFFSEEMSKDEYYKINSEMCTYLKSKNDDRRL